MKCRKLNHVLVLCIEICQVSFFLTITFFIFQVNGEVYVFVGAAFESLNDDFKLQKTAGM